MPPAWSSLLPPLRAAPDAGSALAVLAPALVQAFTGPLPGEPTLLRVIAHRRGAAGYEGLTVHELHTRRAGELGATTSAWRLVQADGAPWLLEVLHRRATPLLPGRAGSDLAVDDGISEQSGMVLSARRATHVLAAPMHDVAGRLRGVLSLELRADRSLEGPPEAWRAALDEGVALAELASPYLLGKPLGGMVPEAADPLLPVVGAAMSERLGALASFARYGDTILLRGPPGTGKTRLAEWVHQRSGRRGPFEPVPVVNLPHELFEGELFGWRKGAHATATEDRKGVVAAARNGTLFLDEIGDLPLLTQAKLLRLLESRRYRPLGADREEEAHVRFVLATNVNLERAVSDGTFRRDLYDRVCAASVELPPLARRTDEIAGWARVFAAERARVLGEPPLEVTDEAARLLEAHPWPGNLRELSHVITNAVALALGRGAAQLGREEVLAALGPHPDTSPPGPLAERMAALGRAFADEALQRQAAGRPALRLAHADVVRHYALRAAHERLGGARAALLAFGEDGLVGSRNEHGAIKRAQRATEAFEAHLGDRGS